MRNVYLQNLSEWNLCLETSTDCFLRQVPAHSNCHSQVKEFDYKLELGTNFVTLIQFHPM
jgi:hypothetical protein